jgi:hypothetical protein
VTDYVGFPLDGAWPAPSSGFNVTAPVRKSELTGEAQ